MNGDLHGGLNDLRIEHRPLDEPEDCPVRRMHVDLQAVGAGLDATVPTVPAPVHRAPAMGRLDEGTMAESARDEPAQEVFGVAGAGLLADGPVRGHREDSSHDGGFVLADS